MTGRKDQTFTQRYTVHHRSSVFTEIDEVEEISVWARTEQIYECLKQYVDLTNGIPSVSVFGRILRMIDPNSLRNASSDGQNR